jgi:hypothetical protein
MVWKWGRQSATLQCLVGMSIRVQLHIARSKEVHSLRRLQTLSLWSGLTGLITGQLNCDCTALQFVRGTALWVYCTANSASVQYTVYCPANSNWGQELFQGRMSLAGGWSAYH